LLALAGLVALVVVDLDVALVVVALIMVALVLVNGCLRLFFLFCAAIFFFLSAERSLKLHDPLSSVACGGAVE